jgi:aerobic carbon-monoxide dehydrogenase medium subunit
MKPAPLSYRRPTTLAEALDDLHRHGAQARVIAGGQSLGPMLNLRLAQPEHLIDISRIDALRTAAAEDDRLAVGACVTHARIEDGEIADVTAGLMRHVAHGIAYRPVRNRGTIGGSLAHADPAADWLTTMIALDASVRLQSRSGRRDLKVSELVTGSLETCVADGEVVTHVLVPRLSGDARWGHAKYARKPGDFAESMAVAVLDRARGSGRAVLGRRSEPPVLLRRTSQQVVAEAGKASADRLTEAVEADLAELQLDRNDWALHRAIVTRAVRGLHA